MSKRKRDDARETYGSEAKRSTLHRPAGSPDSVEDHFARGTRELARALKQAKGFERQRLGKRLKEAAKAEDAAAVQRINAEIATLKSLESRADLAQQHLYKVLLRVKSIREAPDLPKYVEISPRNEEDATIANVTSRMFNSKAARSAINRAVANVQECLGLEDESSARSLPKGSDSSKIAACKVESGSTPSSNAASATESDHGSEEHGDGNDFAEFDHLVASSSEEDSSEATPPPESVNGDDSDAHEGRTNGRAISAAAKSSFLPSLSMGGFLSGSDSEPEDLEELGPPRKNRRGQRARQQIWEKKFGARAKHLHLDSKDRNAGWDAKRGAQSAGERRRPGQPWRKERAPTMASGSNDIALGRRVLGQKKKSEDGPLHPSWEAKKRAKEREGREVAFQGKKTTFE